MPLALSDDELAAVMGACQPRCVLVTARAAGPGVIHRVAAVCSGSFSIRRISTSEQVRLSELGK